MNTLRMHSSRSLVGLVALIAPQDTRRYTAPVTSKKDVIGFSSPKKLCDESRSFPAGPAALSFVPPVLGGSDGRARALPVLARASRSANPFEPPPSFSSECGGFSKPKLLEAIHG
jgi:hypothetical protein